MGTGAWKFFPLWTVVAWMYGCDVCSCVCTCGVCMCDVCILRLQISVFIKHSPPWHTPHLGKLGPVFSFLTRDGAWIFPTPGWVLEHSLLVAALSVNHASAHTQILNCPGGILQSVARWRGPVFPQPAWWTLFQKLPVQRYGRRWSNRYPLTSQHP